MLDLFPLDRKAPPAMGDPVWSVALPDNVEPPLRVFVNSAPAEEGTDYIVEGRWLRFSRPLVPQQNLSFWRRFMLAIGIGVYGDLKADSVDVSYHAGGTMHLASNLTIIAPVDGVDETDPSPHGDT